MARYTKVLKSLAHNAVGNKRIESAAPAGNNYYVTGATLGDAPNYTLTLARNGGLSNVTVNLDALVSAGTIGGSITDNQIAFGTTTANSIEGSANLTFDGTTLTYTSTDAGTAAGPELDLFRNSASPEAADYIGQVRFLGESSTGVQRTYAKITGKIGDPTNSTEDGIIEMMTRKNGSNNIAVRLTDSEFKIMNDTDFSVDTSTLYVDSTNNRVGIGTTSPNSKLTVQGDLDIPVNSRFRAGSGGANTGLDIYFNNSDSNSVIENRASGGDLVFRQMHNGKDYIFKADNDSGTEQEIMRIDGSNARVGIGTSSPSAKLHVQGSSKLNDWVYLSGSASQRIGGYDTQIWSIANGGTTPATVRHVFATSLSWDNNVELRYQIPSTVGDGSGVLKLGQIQKNNTNYSHGETQFFTSGAARLTINKQGRVGINTTSPSHGLTVFNTDFYLNSGDMHISQNKYFKNANDGGQSHGFPSSGRYVFNNVNVGIGTSAAASKLDIVSTSNDNTGGIRIGDGSTFAAIYHDSSENLIIDPVSDFIVTGSDDVRIQSSDDFELLADDFYFKNDADNSTMMRITSAGNVGIGTSSPSYNLDVVDNAADHNYVAVTNTSAGTSSLAGFRLQSQTANALLIGHADNRTVSRYGITLAGYTEMLSSTGNGMIIGNSHGAPLIFGTANLERMRILSGGNVGIGTSSPSDKLNINTGAGTFDFRDYNLTYSTSLGIRAESGYLTLATEGANDINLATNGFANKRLVVKSDGKVGIGTTSPSEHFHVQGSSDVQALFESTTGELELRFKDTSSTQYLVTEHSVLSLGAQGSVHADNLNLKAGNVGIGITSPDAPLHILKAAGGANIVTALKLDPDDTTTNSGVSIDFNASTTNTGASLVGSRIIGAREGGNASGFLALYTSPNATSSVPLERMRITSAGKVGIGTTAPSDKLDVQDGYIRVGQTGGGQFKFVPHSSSNEFGIYDANNTAYRFYIDSTGDIGIGTQTPNEKLTVEGVLSLDETSAPSATSGYGKIYVKSSDSKLYFMNDSGTETDLTAGGGGTIGGTVSSGFIPVASSADTLADGVLFTSGATESMYIGATPGTLNSANYNTTLGYQAGDDITEGDENTLIGQSAGANITTGDANTNLGRLAGSAMTTQTNNTIVGSQAGQNLASSYNTMVGAFAGYNTAALGSYNSFFGFGAGQNIQGAATRNIAIGLYAHYSDTDASAATANNIAIGTEAMKEISTGYENVGIGKEALLNLKGGIENTVMGSQAGYSISTGGYNVAIGSDAFRAATTANYNVAIGKNTMNTGVVTSPHNIGIGYQANKDVAGGSGYNIAIGAYAGQSITTSAHNIFIGREAGVNSDGVNHVIGIGYEAAKSLTTASNAPVMIGVEAGETATTARDAVVIGYTAGKNAADLQYQTYIGSLAGSNASGATASGSVAIGYYAGSGINGLDAIAIGKQSMRYGPADGSDRNIAIGASAMRGVSADRLVGDYNIAIGYQTARDIKNGSDNVAIGRNAMVVAASDTTDPANNNIAIGINAGYQISSDSNIFIGPSAGRYVTTSSLNIGIGTNACRGDSTSKLTSTGRNVAVGYEAMAVGYTTGRYNVAIGMDAMATGTTASGNTAVGYAAMENSATTTVGNVAIGYYAGREGMGNYNVIMGDQAHRGVVGVSTGEQNVAIGRQAMYAQTTSSFNVAVGYQAADSLTTGGSNTAVGWKALAVSSTGSQNVALGYESLLNTTKVYNVGLGYRAGRELTTGERNTIIGHEAGYNASTLGSSTIIGQQAGYHVSGAADAVYVGRSAGYFVSGTKNTFVGTSAGRSNTGLTFASQENVAIGRNAFYFNSTANYNVAIGADALQGAATGMSGDNNVAIGRQAGLNATTAHSNVIIGRQAGQDITTAQKAVVIGSNAGHSLAGQSAAVLIGFEAGRNQNAGSGGSVAIGHQALYSGTQNYQDVAIGINAGKKATGASANSVYIGSHAGPTSTGVVQNKLYIHNAESDTPLIYGDFAGPSVTVNGALGVTGSLSVTGSTLAVQKEIKNDIVGTHTISDSYSHYMATADNQTGSPTCTITCPASPSVGDEYFIVAQCIYASAIPSSALVQITPNTGQTINSVVGAGSNIALHQVSSGTGAGGAPVISYKTAHLICIDNGQWVLTVSDVGPTS